MKFGIIGTNWITDRFIIAANEHPDFSIGAIYSRTEETGREFADKHNDQQCLYRYAGNVSKW